MSSNPYSGAVPLNYQQYRQDKIAKAAETSYRSGIVHPSIYRSPHNDKTIMPRNNGNPILRRYPDGRLDISYAAQKVIDMVHKVQDGGWLTDMERAILSLTLPGQFGKLLNAKMAQTITKLTEDERIMIALHVDKHLREEKNWNAGLGGGSVPGRSQTRG